MRLSSRLDVKLISPAVAVGFVVFWGIAEFSRASPLPSAPSVVVTGLWWWLGLYGLAIGLAVFRPVVSIVIVVLVPLLQIIGILSPPESTSWPVYGATLYVAFAVARTASMRVARAALIAGVVHAVLAGAAMTVIGDWVSWTGSGATVLGFGDMRIQWTFLLAAAGAVLYGSAWTLGFLFDLQARRAADRNQLDQVGADLREAEFELRSVRERSAIAQEVHDVLAHSLAVVIAVADGSRFLRERRPETTDEALREIADAARSALVDLRGLMEELTDSSSRPQPGLDDLEPLLERVRAAGIAVTIEHFGDPADLTPIQQLSVYRIVQEGLTNALKHSGAGPRAAVVLDWRGTGLSIVIRSSGDRDSPGPVESTGAGGRAYGIRGMKDRAHLAGGWLTAGPDGGDAFAVTAFIPTREDRSAGGSGREDVA